MVCCAIHDLVKDSSISIMSHFDIYLTFFLWRYNKIVVVMCWKENITMVTYTLSSKLNNSSNSFPYENPSGEKGEM